MELCFVEDDFYFNFEENDAHNTKERQRAKYVHKTN